jgi:hypothetical protein
VDFATREPGSVSVKVIRQGGEEIFSGSVAEFKAFCEADE